MTERGGPAHRGPGRGRAGGGGEAVHAVTSATLDLPPQGTSLSWAPGATRR
jgi:hypothetical protein